MLDVDATEMLAMIGRLFAERRVISSFEVTREARLHHLGRDGERAVWSLQSGRYTKEELTDALTDAVFASAEAREAAIRRARTGLSA